MNGLIKALVLLMLAYVIHRQIIAREQIEDIWHIFVQQWRAADQWLLLAAVVLMPLNWGFETLKWRCLTRGFVQQSFFRAYQAVLGGVTLSIFTPNRIGEYGGRILFIPAKDNWKGVVATLVGSFSQLLVLIGLGVLGLVFFAEQHLMLEGYVLWGVFFMGVCLCTLMLFCFYNIGLVIPLVKKLPFAKYLGRAARSVAILRAYDRQVLSQTLVLALGRYFVYSVQYYLLLQFFGLELGFGSTMVGISTIFLLQTSIPLPPFLGLVVRGSLALHIWGYYGFNELAILAATFGLWTLNLILPALIGTIFIFNTNVIQSLGYHDTTPD